MKKDFIKALIFVTVLVAVCLYAFPYMGNGPVSTAGVKENEGVVIYNPVNFRSSMNVDTDSNIIGKITYGEIVEVLEVIGDWKKIRYDGVEGYVIGESVCEYRLMFDVSDYNWGSEYRNISEFKAFTKRALGASKLGGYYIQVQRTFHENNHWKELVQALDELDVPYGLYLYSSANTKEDAKAEYESYLKLIEGVSLKNNVFPFMVNLEQRGEQSAVIEFYNEELGDNYILYAGAYDMNKYGYNNLVDDYWIAHYEVCKSYPTKWYTAYEDVIPGMEDAVIWQFTSKGDARLFGTEHLDINVVSEEWYKRYVK